MLNTYKKNFNDLQCLSELEVINDNLINHIISGCFMMTKEDLKLLKLMIKNIYRDSKKDKVNQ